MSTFRSGTVGLVGRPNTGKSSLLNRLLGHKLAIVSPRAILTRKRPFLRPTSAAASATRRHAPGWAA
jgi:predicted GTPase